MALSEGVRIFESRLTRRSGWWVVGAVVGEAVVLAAIVGDMLGFLPSHLETQVGHNSEVFVLAIGLTLLLAWSRGRRRPRGGLRIVVGVAGLVLFMALGILVMRLDGLPRVKTLNEPVFALAILLPYVLIPQRRPRALAVAVSAVFVLATAVLFHTELVRSQAESIVALILAPLGLDVLARWVPRGDDDGPDHSVPWGLFLLLAPVALMVLERLPIPAGLDAVATYGSRANEAFWGLFLVQATAWLAWRPERR